MPALNRDKLTLPVSPKVIAASGAGSVTAAALAEVATTYHLDTYLPGGLLPLAILLATGLVAGAAGYLKRHDVFTQGQLDAANTVVGEFVDYTAAEQDDRPAVHLVGDATHINGPPIALADANPAAAATDPVVADADDSAVPRHLAD